MYTMVSRFYGKKLNINSKNLKKILTPIKLPTVNQVKTIFIKDDTNWILLLRIYIFYTRITKGKLNVIVHPAK